MFEVGQKVVCVRDDWTESCCDWPRKGRTYTVSSEPIPRWIEATYGRGAYINILEMDHVGHCWQSDFFRPAEERRFTESMELLRKLAEPGNALVKDDERFKKLTAGAD